MAQTFPDFIERVHVITSLADLFDLWIEAHMVDPEWRDTFPEYNNLQPPEEFKTSFCVDGVSCLKGDYKGDQKANVLFILKESDAQRYILETGIKRDFWFNNSISGDGVRTKYRNRFEQVLKYYYSMPDELPWPDDAPIGYMNLNKRGGYVRTNPKRLQSYIRNYHLFILKEIELISPEIIFLCGCHDLFVGGLQDADKDNKTTRWNSLHYWNGNIQEILINPDAPATNLAAIYHPSYRWGFKKCLSNLPRKNN